MKKLTFKIDPFTGIGTLAGFAPAGHRLIKIDRKGTKAVCTYAPVTKVGGKAPND